MQLYTGGTAITDATDSTFDGDKGLNWSIDISLAEGTHSITAKVVDAGSNAGPASAALDITVDTTAPTVTKASSGYYANYASGKLEGELSKTVPAGQDIYTKVVFSEGVVHTEAKDGTARPPVSYQIGSTATPYAVVAHDTTLASGDCRANHAKDRDEYVCFYDVGSDDGAFSFMVGTALEDIAGNTLASEYTHEPVLTLDNTAPAMTPGTLDLASADDTGSSDDDDITKNTDDLTITGALSGDAATGEYVQLYSAGTAISGATDSTFDGDKGLNWSIDITLAEGAHSITAKVVDAASNAGPASAALTITVDTTAPTVTKASSGYYAKYASTSFSNALSGTVPTGQDIYTKVVFSEDVAHTEAKDGTARPPVSYQIGSTATPYAVVAHDTTLASGDCRANHASERDEYACFYDVGSDDGAFSFVVGTDLADIAGNALASEYTHEPVLTLDSTAPTVTPGTLDLASADDTGASDDDITKNTDDLTITGTLSGDASTGEYVQLYAGGTAISGATDSTFDGTEDLDWSIDITLAEGTHSITAKVVDAGSNAGPASAALDITVDTTAPTVTKASSGYYANYASGKLEGELSKTVPAGQDIYTKVVFSEGVVHTEAKDGTARPPVSYQIGSTATPYAVVAHDTTLASGDCRANHAKDRDEYVCFYDVGSDDGAFSFMVGTALEDIAGNTLASEYTHEPVLTLDNTAPAMTPGTLDLASADDTGSSDDDDITKNTDDLTITGALSGDAATGEYVQLYSAGTAISGATDSTFDGDKGLNWSIDITLAEGAHSITAKVVDAASNAGPASAALTITVDTTAPTVTKASSGYYAKYASTSFSNALSGTVPTGQDIYTKVVFSEDVAHTEAKDGTARPPVSYQIGSTATPYAVVAHDTTLASGDCRANHANERDEYACFYDVGSDDGAFSFVVGTDLADIAGNALASEYTHEPVLTLDSTAPTVTPGTLDLASADDTGSSDDDDITKNTNALTITGTLSGDASTGEYVQLYSAGTAISGATDSTFDGTDDRDWSIDITLAEGTHFITAKVVDAGSNAGPASAALDITVDTTAPTVTKASSGYYANYASGKLEGELSKTVPAGQDIYTKVVFSEGVVHTEAKDGTARPPVSYQIGSTATPYAVVAHDTTLASGDCRANHAKDRDEYVCFYDVGSDDGAFSFVVGTELEDIAGNTLASEYTHEPVLTLDNTAPTMTPGTLDLASADDTGSSDDDDITKNTDDLTITGALSGDAATGEYVQLYSAGTAISGATDSTFDGDKGLNWSIDITLAEGAHSITAKVVDAASNAGPASAALTITVDTTAPTVTKASSGYYAKYASTSFSNALSGTVPTGQDIYTKVVFSEDVVHTEANGRHRAPAGELPDRQHRDAYAVVAHDTTLASGDCRANHASERDEYACFYDVGSDDGAFSFVVGTDLADIAGNALASEYTHEPVLTLDSTAPTVTPGTLDLASADDTGASDDDITKNTDDLTITGTLSGDASTGEYVQLYAGGTAISGAKDSTFDGTDDRDWSIDITLAEGTHSITAKVVDANSNAGTASAALDITVDTTAPTVTKASSGYYANYASGKLEGELSGTQFKAVSIYTKVAFSEDVVHAEVNGGRARPPVSYKIGSTATQYDVVSSSTTLASGDCRANHASKRDEYACLYTVGKDIHGAFTFVVGTDLEDVAGNALASEYTHDTITVDGRVSPPLREPIRVENVNGSSTACLTVPADHTKQEKVKVYTAECKGTRQTWRLVQRTYGSRAGGYVLQVGPDPDKYVLDNGGMFDPDDTVLVKVGNNDHYHKDLGEQTFDLTRSGTDGWILTFREGRDSSVLWAKRKAPSLKGDVGQKRKGTGAAAVWRLVSLSKNKVTQNATLSALAVVTKPQVSIADATVTEAAGAVLAFTVSLDRAVTAADGTVSVAYATSDGTATAGSDYTATSGSLTFGVGESTKTVDVPVLDDSVDEGSETLTLTLSNATGATLSDATATGTITNSDPMPQAWLARFGRTVTEQVLDGVTGRIEAERTPGREAMLAGQALGVAGATAQDEAALAEVVRAFDRNGGTALDGDGTRASGAFGTFGPRTRALDEPITIGAREALLGSSFTLTLGPQDASSAGTLAFWGRAAQSSFDGTEGTLSLNGDVTTGMLGADYGRDGWLAGLMVSQTSAEGGYDGGAGNLSGDVEATLTAATAYGSASASERMKLWGALGHGAGALTLTPNSDGKAKETDLDWTMAATGVRSDLLAPADATGPTLALVTDAMWTRTTSDAVSGAKDGNLAAAQADVTRLRAGLEAGWPLGGGALTPKLELGVRHDGGDAETGFGMDVGGGLVLSDPQRGLEADIQGRGLLTHESSGFRERGFSGALSWHQKPGSDRGATLTLTQTIGGASSGGAEALLSRTAMDSAATGGTGEEHEFRRLEARLGYGFATFGDRFTSVPELGMGRSDTDHDYSLGWRLIERASVGPVFGLDLEVSRRERADGGGDPEHGLVLGFGWHLADTPGLSFDMRIEGSRRDFADDDLAPEDALGLWLTAQW